MDLNFQQYNWNVNKIESSTFLIRISSLLKKKRRIKKKEKRQRSLSWVKPDISAKLTSASISSSTTSSRSEFGEFGVDDLISLCKYVYKIFCLPTVLRCEKGITCARGLATTRSSYPVNVVFGWWWIIEVNDVLNFINVYRKLVCQNDNTMAKQCKKKKIIVLQFQEKLSLWVIPRILMFNPITI